MRAGRGFRVVLNTKGIERGGAQYFNTVDVEIHVRDFDPRRETLCSDGEAVVVAGDFHSSRGKILDRLIAAAMPKLELVRFPAEGQTQKLMPQTNAKDRDTAQKLLDVLN